MISRHGYVIESQGAIGQLHGWTLEDIANGNVEKLQKRYAKESRPPTAPKKGGEAREVIKRNHRYPNAILRVLGNAHTSDLDGRETVEVTFTRVIVHPGQQVQSSPALPQIEGKASHALPSDDVIDVEPNDIK